MGMFPNVKEISAQFKASFEEMMQILREMLAVLREIRDQKGAPQ
jgi:hypothetical protein